MLCRRGSLSHDGFSERCSANNLSSCSENVLYNYNGGDDAGTLASQQWENSPGTHSP